jgi:hypothetical protein
LPARLEVNQAAEILGFLPKEIVVLEGITKAAWKTGSE